MYVLAIVFCLSIWLFVDGVSAGRAHAPVRIAVSLLLFVGGWVGLLTWNLGDTGRAAFAEHFLGGVLLSEDADLLVEPVLVEGETTESAVYRNWQRQKAFGETLGGFCSFVSVLASFWAVVAAGAFLIEALARRRD
jgi:hypothetical protein